MARKTLSTQRDLQAPPARVWEVLTDLAAYPTWNPFITEAAGELRVGGRLAIVAGGMRFRPVVLRFDPARELRWRGRLVVPGLFDGEHVFRLAPLDGGRATRLTHEEHFSGLLVGPFSRKLDEETLPGFEAMNRALAARVGER